VDLGGVQGMVHFSELDFERGGHPIDLLSEGQQVGVVVLRVDQLSPARSPRTMPSPGRAQGPLRDLLRQSMSRASGQDQSRGKGKPSAR